MIATAMIMSFFSLISAVYSNILKQAKEIAILRSMGCSVCDGDDDVMYRGS